MARRSVRAVEALLDTFFDLYPAEAARWLESLTAEEAAPLLLRTPVARALSILENLIPDVAAQILERIPETAAVPFLAGMDPARAAALLARLEAEVREARLSLLPVEAGRELRTLMSYPPDTAGSLMDPRVATFRPETTVKEALERLRSLGDKRIYDILLVDAEGRLAGSVSLQEIAVAAPSQQIEQLPHGTPVSVQAMVPREELLEGLERQKLTSLPVVDFEGRLLGVIRYEALVTAAQEEASADIQTMTGASREERALSKVSFAIGKRLPWLQINLGTAFLAAAVVGLFEGLIARFTALAVLLPVVAGQAGNTGAQALAVTIRGLALREVRVRHWLQVALKEVGVGLVNGTLVALTTGLAVYVWSGSQGLALVIGLAMVFSMVAAGLAGAGIPMLLTALGQDPAQSSSIILTTITDVTGFASFLGTATLLARLL